jgi:hypothetical protein
VDFNDDGYLDLIAGEREGFVNFFSRKADGTLTEEPDIAANRAVIDVGTNSAPHVIDWDEDGLLDLLIGSDDSQKIIVYLNSGTASEYLFTTPTEVMCNNASIAYRRCIPHVEELNLDGKKDLIIGEDNGCIYFLQNVGTNTSPEFSAAVKLESDGAPIQWPSGQTDVTVWVNDWNEDGRPDILIGNYMDSVYVYLNETPVEIIDHSNQTVTRPYIKNIITGGFLTVSIQLEREQRLQIEIYSAGGKLIKSTNAGTLSAGKHSVGMDISGHPTGIYLIRCKTGMQEVRQRVVLLR